MRLQTEYVETPNPSQAERDLWATVMLDAVDCLSSRSKRLRAEARAWFASNDVGVGTFLWVCAALELSADDIRRNL